MDRWADDVTTATGRTPNFSRGGSSQFVKSQGAAGTVQGVGQHAPVIIQPSRRQQVQEAAQHVADRLATSQPATAPAGAGSKIPPWAQEPPRGFYLEVVKDGQVLQEVPLTKAGTVLGRSPTADLLLDHASISRQHAALCYQPATSCMVLLDLGSVHGTWADGQPVRTGGPVQLKPGSEVRLGASSRHYFLRRRAEAQAAAPSQQGASGAGLAAQPPWANPGGQVAGEPSQPGATGSAPASAPAAEGHERGAAGEGEAPAAAGAEGGRQAKRARTIRFADEAEEGGAVEQVIGYAERGSGFNLVGPRPAKDPSEGRFGDLLKSTRLSAEGRAPAGGSGQVEQQQRQHPGGEEGGDGGGAAAAVAADAAMAQRRAAGQAGGRAGIGHAAGGAGKGVRSAMELFNKQLHGRQQGKGSGGDSGSDAVQQGAGGGLSNLFGGLPPPSNI